MHRAGRLAKPLRTCVPSKAANRLRLAVTAILSGLLLFGCASHPETPEFREAHRQCRRAMQRCPMIGTNVSVQCVRSAELTCMANHGYAWVHGNGWVRVARTDRDVSEELDQQLSKEARKTDATTATPH